MTHLRKRFHQIRLSQLHVCWVLFGGFAFSLPCCWDRIWVPSKQPCFLLYLLMISACYCPTRTQYWHLAISFKKEYLCSFMSWNTNDFSLFYFNSCFRIAKMMTIWYKYKYPLFVLFTWSSRYLIIYIMLTVCCCHHCGRWEADTYKTRIWTDSITCVAIVSYGVGQAISLK